MPPRPTLRKVAFDELLTIRGKAYKDYKEVTVDFDVQGNGMPMVDFSTWNFDGLTPPNDLLVKEGETPGIFDGDMVHQFPEAYGPFVPVFSPQILDLISFRLDSQNFPCMNGRAYWNIGTTFWSNSVPDWSTKINVVQEYILTDGKWSVIKGNVVLLNNFQVANQMHRGAA